MESAVAFVADPVVPDTAFVVLQDGVVRVISGGVVQETPFLDLREVISRGGERGLLGLAFPPDAADSLQVFVNFTDRSGHTVIARFTRRPDNLLAVAPESRFDLQWPDGRRFIQQPYSNHNGGHLAFGPDGYPVHRPRRRRIGQRPAEPRAVARRRCSARCSAST